MRYTSQLYWEHSECENLAHKQFSDVRHRSLLVALNFICLIACLKAIESKCEAGDLCARMSWVRVGCKCKSIYLLIVACTCSWENSHRIAHDGNGYLRFE